MPESTPRLRIGSIGARSSEHIEGRRGRTQGMGNPNLQEEQLVPPGIVQSFNIGLDLSDYTYEGVQEGFTRYWDCVDEIMKRADGKLDRIGWGGFPMSPQLGRKRCLELIEETTQRTGVPATCDVEGWIDCIKTLGFNRVVMASRWKDDLNRKIVNYFRDAGVEILHITSANQMAPEAFSMSLDMGIRLAWELSRDAVKAVPNAQCIVMPGGVWRPRGLVPMIEEVLGVMVVRDIGTWRLIHEGYIPPVKGWGKLLEMG